MCACARARARARARACVCVCVCVCVCERESEREKVKVRETWVIEKQLRKLLQIPASSAQSQGWASLRVVGKGVGAVQVRALAAM